MHSTSGPCPASKYVKSTPLARTMLGVIAASAIGLLNSNPMAAADVLRTRRERWFHGPPASMLIRNQCPTPISKNSILNSGGLSSMASGRTMRPLERRSLSLPGRGVRQDQHPGAPGGPLDRQWRRSPQNSADDLLAPGRRRDGAACRADRARGDWRQRRYHDRCALGRDLPRDWRAALARVCGPDRPRFCFHHSRPRGLGRSDESYAARARVLEDGKPVSSQRHMSCRLFAMRQRRVAHQGCAASVLPVVCRLGRRTEAAVRRLCRGEATTECPRLR